MSLLQSLKREGFVLAGRLNRLGQSLAEGATKAKQFAGRALNLLAGAHTKAAEVGRRQAGDPAPEHPRDAEIGGRRARQQMTYMEGFAGDLRGGRYAEREDGGEGAMARQRRTLLYGKALVGTANESWAETKEDLAGGEIRARWMLGVADHCRTCVEEAEKGWRPISEFTRFPADGSTLCKSNCQCHLETDDGDRSFVHGAAVSAFMVLNEPPPVERVIDTLDDLLSKRAKERAYLLDPDGKRVRWVMPDGKEKRWIQGTEDHLLLPAETARQMEGKVFIHNHPRGTSFSWRDVQGICYNKPSKAVISSPKYRYTLEPPEGGWTERFWEKTVAPLYVEVHFRKRLELTDLLIRGEITAGEFDEREMHETWTEIAEKTGMKYDRRKRGGS